MRCALYHWYTTTNLRTIKFNDLRPGPSCVARDEATVGVSKYEGSVSWLGQTWLKVGAEVAFDGPVDLVEEVVDGWVSVAADGDGDAAAPHGHPVDVVGDGGDVRRDAVVAQVLKAPLFANELLALNLSWRDAIIIF